MDRAVYRSELRHSEDPVSKYVAIPNYFTFYLQNQIADEKPVPEDTHLILLHRCVRIVLTKEHPEITTTTYEAICDACRSWRIKVKASDAQFNCARFHIRRVYNVARKSIWIEWITT